MNFIEEPLLRKMKIETDGHLFPFDISYRSYYNEPMQILHTRSDFHEYYPDPQKT